MEFLRKCLIEEDHPNILSIESMIKKIVVMAIAVLLLFYTGQQILWYNRFNSNLIIYVSNQSSQEIADIDITLDGEKIVSDDLSNEFFHDYKIYPKQISFGKHTLEVSANKSSVSKKLSFIIVPVRWIIVELVDDQENSLDQKYDLLVSIQSTPIIIE